jgi:FMN phosphatase YigB (HAD superfamily)
MKIKAVLFDLDGTLLPMDQDAFTAAYIGGLGKVAVSRAYDAKAMANVIYSGLVAMVKNDGKKTNEQVFWNTLVNTFGPSMLNDRHMYDEFYQTDFQNIKNVCGFEPLAKEVIELVRKKGLRAVLATNPVFPSVATESRIRWAGLSTSDFELFTTYENYHYCKPSLDYYREILSKINLAPEECLMVGNDVGDDMVAEKLGLKVFLLTDCLINKKGEDISVYPRGNIDDLIKYINSLR